MSVQLYYLDSGRGAWPQSGRGGTLSVKGDLPGGFFRAPADGSAMKMIGLQAYKADQQGAKCCIDDYATFMATKAVQSQLRITEDGLWGAQTDAAVKKFQAAHELVADGVFGPNTAKAMWRPLAIDAAQRQDNVYPNLVTMMLGHIGWESGWDAAAVGGSTPQDLGLGQINGPTHPELNTNDRLTPSVTMLWMANFIDGNLQAMDGNTRDGIAAYNLGIGGARSWVKAGRPDVWARTSGTQTIVTSVKKYIDSVLAAAQAAGA